MHFYGKLIGKARSRLEAIDINVIRKRNQLSGIQRSMLIESITVAKIEDALKSIGDLKAPGVDDFNSKFLKLLGTL